jgi:hypothetical protein
VPVVAPTTVVMVGQEIRLAERGEQAKVHTCIFQILMRVSNCQKSNGVLLHEPSGHYWSSHVCESMVTLAREASKKQEKAKVKAFEELL